MLPLAPAQAADRPAPAQLPAMTVIGTSSAAELSTLERADIEMGGIRAVGDLLRHLPGVHVDRNSATGGVASLYLRGADPNYTAVLLDGIKVNDPTNTRGGSFDFASLPASGIQTIEVLSGPSSALLGADALAGAVNLVSRRGRGAPQLELHAGVGDAGQRQARIALLGAAGPGDFALGAAALDAGSASPDAAAAIEHMHGNLGWALSENSALRLTLRHGDSALQAFPEDSGGPRHAERREPERRAVEESLGGLTYERLNDRGWRYALQFGAYRRAEGIDSPGVAPGQRDPVGIPANLIDNRFWRHSLKAHLGLPLSEATLLLGMQAEQEDGRSAAVFNLLGPFLPDPLQPGAHLLPPLPGDADFALRRTTRAVLLDIDLPALGLLWEGSLRREDPEGHDALALPRMRISYPRGPYVWSIGGGKGFKLPSFFALGNPLVGNPDLKPEHSTGADLSMTRSVGDDGFLRLAVFAARYRNAIDFEEGPPPRLVNRTGVRTRGAEFGFGWAPATDWHWRLQLNYVKAEIENSAERLRNRPRWTGGSLLRWQLGTDWTLQAEAAHVGRQFDSSIPTGERALASYTRFDLRLQWTPLRALELQAGIDNLLDAAYEEYIGFPGAGRSARLGLGLRL